MGMNSDRMALAPAQRAQRQPKAAALGTVICALQQTQRLEEKRPSNPEGPVDRGPRIPNLDDLKHNVKKHKLNGVFRADVCGTAWFSRRF